jgi:CheY-like chemotaxis protein
MPGMSGLELLSRAKALRPDVPVIMTTDYGGAETAPHGRPSKSRPPMSHRKSDLGILFLKNLPK